MPLENGIGRNNTIHVHCMWFPCHCLTIHNFKWLFQNNHLKVSVCKSHIYMQIPNFHIWEWNCNYIVSHPNIRTSTVYCISTKSSRCDFFKYYNTSHQKPSTNLNKYKIHYVWFLQICSSLQWDTSLMAHWHLIFTKLHVLFFPQPMKMTVGGW